MQKILFLFLVLFSASAYALDLPEGCFKGRTLGKFEKDVVTLLIAKQDDGSYFVAEHSKRFYWNDPFNEEQKTTAYSVSPSSNGKWFLGLQGELYQAPSIFGLSNAALRKLGNSRVRYHRRWVSENEISDSGNGKSKVYKSKGTLKSIKFEVCSALFPG